jgi:hypothetical protein
MQKEMFVCPAHMGARIAFCGVASNSLWLVWRLWVCDFLLSWFDLSSALYSQPVQLERFSK